MERTSLRQQQCRNAIRARWCRESEPLDPLRLALSIIVEGLQPEKTFEMIMWNNLKIDDFSEVYEKMHEVCNEIISMATLGGL